MIKMIFAHGDNGEFGKGDSLPWDSPEDLQNFKEYTRGCTLVMGGATFKSLPCKLPGRKHIVLGRPGATARNGDEPDATLPAKDSEHAIQALSGDVCVIGGTGLLYTWAELVDAASVTHVHGEFPEADVFIDEDSIRGELRRRFSNITVSEFPGITITNYGS